MTDKTIDSEDKGDSKSPQLGEQPEQVKSLTEVMASLELPWPKDVFGEVPEGDWHAIDVFAKTLGYRIDTISATLMRRGWANYERLLREAVNDLVEQGFVVTTDPSNPQKAAQEANKARIESLREIEKVGLEFDKGFRSSVAHNCILNRIAQLTADKEEA